MIRYRIERLIKRLKFAFGFYNGVFLMPYTFRQEAYEQSDASDQICLGDMDMTLSLLDKGIKHFYKRTPVSCVASIGYDPDTKTWWGWSHRAIASYKVGKIIKPDQIGYEKAFKYFFKDNPNDKSPPLELFDEKDCRKMAEIFAEEVS